MKVFTLGTIAIYMIILLFIVNSDGYSFQRSIRSKINEKRSLSYHQHILSMSPISSMSSISGYQGLQAKPGLHIKLKGRVLNPWGIYCALVTFITASLIYPVFLGAKIISDLLGDVKRRRILDWLVHYWAKLTISLCLGNPTLLGSENLPTYKETVIYVPNHTSFLDILVFSGFVPRPFKYFSKAEIGNIPIIGSAMNMAKHVFLKRDDFQSSLEATATCIQRLKDGNSMVLFAEGTRSNDGKLKNFKKGAFQIAKEAQVKVIPVSIGNLYKWMPNAAILPLAPMRNTYIQIHKALDAKELPVSQLKNLCFEAVNSGLPEYQKTDSVRGLPKDSANDSISNS